MTVWDLGPKECSALLSVLTYLYSDACAIFILYLLCYTYRRLAYDVSSNLRCPALCSVKHDMQKKQRLNSVLSAEGDVRLHACIKHEASHIRPTRARSADVE